MSIAYETPGFDAAERASLNEPEARIPRPSSIDPDDGAPRTVRPHGWINPDVVLRDRLVIAHNRIEAALADLSRVIVEARIGGASPLKATTTSELWARGLEYAAADVAEKIDRLRECAGLPKVVA